VHLSSPVLWRATCQNHGSGRCDGHHETTFIFWMTRGVNLMRLPLAAGPACSIIMTAPLSRPISRCHAYALGRVKTFSCKRSELDEVATRAIFPDFDYALIAAISG
jgi:hypothetical protein